MSAAPGPGPEVRSAVVAAGLSPEAVLRDAAAAERSAKVAKSASSPSVGRSGRPRQKNRAIARRTLDGFIRSRSDGGVLRTTYMVQNTHAKPPGHPPAALAQARSPAALVNFHARAARTLKSNYQEGNAWITEPEMVEIVEKEFGPGQPHLSNPNMSTVQVGCNTVDFPWIKEPAWRRLAKAEERLAAARMEVEQRDNLQRPKPVHVSRTKREKLIMPFMDYRVDEQGAAGALGFLEQIHPVAGWSSDYRDGWRVEAHNKAEKARFESVPPRARPIGTHQCIEPNTVRAQALLNHRVIGLPPHNPNNRPAPM